MQVKTITTAAGVNEIDFGNDSSQSTAHFYWLKNLGDSILYVSANPNPIAEKDDVAELPAKGAVSVETDEGKIYVLGAGKVEIHRTNSKFCPFDWQSSGSGGGGVIDAYTKTESDAKYAQKTDIPSSLPANGGNADYATNAGNADKLDGLHADDFAKSTDPRINGNMIFESSSNQQTINTIYSATDILVLRNIAKDASSLCDVMISNDGVRIVNATQNFKIGDGGNADTVDGMHIKSVTMGITTNEQSYIVTGLPVATTKIISVLCSTQSLVGHAWQLDGYSTWFASFYSTSNMATPMPNTPVSFTIYYFEE